jgi:hypothetical protein
MTGDRKTAYRQSGGNAPALYLKNNRFETLYARLNGVEFGLQKLQPGFFFGHGMFALSK